MSRFCRIFIFLICASSLLAQTPDTAIVRGQVLDPSRAAVPSAEVKITNTLTGAERTTRTDSSGNFSFSGLPAGTYSLTAHKDQFADFQRELTLAGGTSANVQLQLNIAGVATEVVVTGAVGAVRSDEPQLGDRLGAAEINEMPLLNSRITYLPLLNAANRPAINQGDVFMNQSLFTTNGSGRRQTAWVVDGATGNDSWAANHLQQRSIGIRAGNDGTGKCFFV